MIMENKIIEKIAEIFFDECIHQNMFFIKMENSNIIKSYDLNKKDHIIHRDRRFELGATECKKELFIQKIKENEVFMNNQSPNKGAKPATTPSIEIRIRASSSRIYQNVWEKLSTKEEKKCFFTLFSQDLIYSFDLLSLNNSEYVNSLLMHYYTQENLRENAKSILKIVNQQNLILYPETLINMSKYNKYEFNSLEMQHTLKNYVETYLPQENDSLKILWPKIDLSSSKDISPYDSGDCIWFSFNKKYLYNLQKEKSLDFYNSRLKTINTFLNKKLIQKSLSISRSVLDGIQDGRNDYRFIIMDSLHPEVLKDVLIALVNHVLTSENEPNIKEMQVLINYVLLERKMTSENTPQNIKNVIKI